MLRHRPNKITSFSYIMGCFKPKGGPDGEDDKKAKEANKRIEKLLAKDKQVYKATHRLLLLGM